MTTASRQTILVTGASGMLGLKLVEVFSKRYTTIKTRFDITDSSAIANVRKRFKHIDAIIHCAAMTNVNECELHPAECWRTNVQGTAHVTQLARHYGANLIYISTPMVFSGRQGNYREGDRPRPQNQYARSKLAGEKIVLRYRHGLVVRANPIGKRPLGAHPSFIQWFVDRARANESFSLFSDVTINPISTTTLSHDLKRILQNFKPGIVHLGSRDTVSKADIWRFILKRFPHFSASVVEKHVDATPAGRIAKHPREMWLNVTKARHFNIVSPLWRREVELVLDELGYT